MFRFVNAIRGAFAAAAFAAASVASAAPVAISVTTFDAASFAAQKDGLTVNAFETFEGFAAGQIAGPLTTAFGTLSTLGGTGSGGSVTGAGTDLAIRTSPNFGRVNTTEGGRAFADSNDTLGMALNIGGVGQFNSILFNISDVGDAGGNLSIQVGDMLLETILKGRGNGLVDTVLITFSTFIDSAVVSLRKDKLNDGFGLDDVVVGSNVAPIPLPAAAWMLLAGLAGLGWLGRRRAA